MRSTTVNRVTTETEISLALSIDGSGKYSSELDCGFISHMLELFARHGRFDIEIKAVGDTDVDYHHLVEDLGIVLGTAFSNCLGNMKGIKRYGSFILPMDETLILSATDISGRSFLAFDVEMPTQKVGDFDTELVKEFFHAFSRSLPSSVHIKQLSGENTHHIIEAIFKCFARALADAVSIDENFKDEIPSTKGVLV